MPRLFDSFVMVNWSAASKPSTGKDSIWIGALVPDARLRLTFRASNPATRAEAYTQLKDLLERLTKRGDRILLGVDFPLGFPAGTSKALNLKGDTPWQSMRTFLNKEMKDKPDNTNNRFALAARMNRLISDGPFPFWGCPKRDALTTLTIKKVKEHEAGDLPEFRNTELQAIKDKVSRPQPIWKIAYAGAVGGQAMTGIPVFDKLRSEFDAMRVWPFELPLETMDEEALDGVQIVLTEVSPALVETTQKDTEIRDEAQVRTIAEYFADLDETNKIAQLFGGPTNIDEDTKFLISSEEGWILGL